MKFGDDETENEVGGKELGPVSIDLQGDQRRGQALIGPARAMLGNLKQRMQFNQIKQGSDRRILPEQKTISTLFDLLYSGELVGKDVPIEKAKKTNIEVTVNGEIVVSSIKGYGVHPDQDRIVIDVGVQYKKVGEVGGICLGYIVQAFVEFSDPNAKDYLFVLTTPSDKELKNNWRNLNISGDANVPFDNYSDNGAKYWPVYEVDDDGNPTGGAEHTQIVMIRDKRYADSYSFDGPQTNTPFPDSAPPTIHGTLVYQYDYITYCSAQYDFNGERFVVATGDYHTPYYLDYWPNGNITGYLHAVGLNAFVSDLSNQALQAEFDVVSDYLHSLEGDNRVYYPWTFTGENNTPIFRRDDSQGLIAGAGFIKNSNGYEFTDRELGNGEASVFMMPFNEKRRFTFADTIRVAAENSNSNYTTDSQVATTGGVAYSGAPSPHTELHVTENCHHNVITENKVTDAFGIPEKVEWGIHTVIGSGGTGHYKVYLLIEDQGLIELNVNDVIEGTTLKIKVGEFSEMGEILSVI